MAEGAWEPFAEIAATVHNNALGRAKEDRLSSIRFNPYRRQPPPEKMLPGKEAYAKISEELSRW